jgi:FkbM family methyltransferase
MIPNNPSDFFEFILPALMECPGSHARTSPLYKLLDPVAKQSIAESPLASETGSPVHFGAIGEIVFPYFASMGAINSLDLFGLDELIIFAFYAANRTRYKQAVDIGANIGLHSIMMSRCGWSVRAYEPDPKHIARLRHDLELNRIQTVELIEGAVSSESGEKEFIRVVGNTTGSHLAGAKANPYGELEKFPVKVYNISEVMRGADFIKIDAEGHEKDILLATTAADWKSVEVMLEVNSPENAEALWVHFAKLSINAFSQKTGWRRATGVADLPHSYKEGSLFLSKAALMPWPL